MQDRLVNMAPTVSHFMRNGEMDIMLFAKKLKHTNASSQFLRLAAFRSDAAFATLTVGNTSNAFASMFVARCHGLPLILEIAACNVRQSTRDARGAGGFSTVNRTVHTFLSLLRMCLVLAASLAGPSCGRPGLQFDRQTKLNGVANTTERRGRDVAYCNVIPIGIDPPQIFLRGSDRAMLHLLTIECGHNDADAITAFQKKALLSTGTYLMVYVNDEAMPSTSCFEEYATTLPNRRHNLIIDKPTHVMDVFDMRVSTISIPVCIPFSFEPNDFLALQWTADHFIIKTWYDDGMRLNAVQCYYWMIQNDRMRLK